MSHYSEMRRRFFGRVNTELAARSRTVPAGSSGGDNWQRHNLGIAGIHLASAVKRGEMKAEIVFERPDAKAIFDRLLSEKSFIERDFGAELKWFGPSPAAKRARITSFNPAPDIETISDWERQVDWLVSKLDRLYAVFYPRVSHL
jgi:hypothetical protein